MSVYTSDVFALLSLLILLLLFPFVEAACPLLVEAKVLVQVVPKSVRNRPISKAYSASKK